MNREETDSYEIQSDGQMVWVNGQDGVCLARFSPRGIDVHRKLGEMRVLGECLYCTHGPTTEDSWKIFQEQVALHHGIVVSDMHKPTCLPSGFSGTKAGSGLISRGQWPVLSEWPDQASTITSVLMTFLWERLSFVRTFVSGSRP